MTPLEPLSTPGDREAEQQASAVGLRLRKLHTDLYTFENTWCPVLLSKRGDCWAVSRKLDECTGRWRRVYRGPRLETALKHVKRWEERYP